MKPLVYIFFLFTATVLADEQFIADFVLTTRPPDDEYVVGEPVSQDYKEANGVYKGVMKYYYNSAKKESFRQMEYSGSSGLIEKYVTGTSPTDANNERVTMKLIDCGSCTYSPLYIDSDSEKQTYYDEENLLNLSSSSYVKYYGDPKNSKDSSLEKILVTKDNVIELRNIRHTKFSVPNDYFSGCLTKTCGISVDLTFSIDVTGSMSANDIASAKDLMSTLAKKDLFNVGENGSSAAIVTWTYFVELVSHSSTYDIKSNGYLRDNKKFTDAVNKVVGQPWATCISCGYKAGIEMTYLQYIYERGQNLENMPGQILMIMTDGWPNMYYNTEKEKFTIDATSKSYDGSVWNRGIAEVLLVQRLRLELLKRTQRAFTGIDWTVKEVAPLPIMTK